MIGNDMIKRAKYFFNNKKLVHISCNNGIFYNGLIIKILNTDHIILKDRINGETPIFFSQIKNIENFREEEKEYDKKY